MVIDIYIYIYVSVVSNNTYLSGGKTVGSELPEQWGQDGV